MSFVRKQTVTFAAACLLAALSACLFVALHSKPGIPKIVMGFPRLSEKGSFYDRFLILALTNRSERPVMIWSIRLDMDYRASGVGHMSRFQGWSGVLRPGQGYAFFIMENPSLARMASEKSANEKLRVHCQLTIETSWVTAIQRFKQWWIESGPTHAWTRWVPWQFELGPKIPVKIDWHYPPEKQ